MRADNYIRVIEKRQSFRKIDSYSTDKDGNTVRAILLLKSCNDILLPFNVPLFHIPSAVIHDARGDWISSIAVGDLFSSFRVAQGIAMQVDK